MPTVYLNGEYLPLSEARVSVLDRGFTFADGVYEVIPVFSGNVFRIDEHLQRLANSLSYIDIEFPLSANELKNVLLELLTRNPAKGTQQLYLQITRGVADRDHVYSNQITPTFFAMCKSIEEKDFSNGVNVITSEDIRWKFCHIKSIALLANVLLKKMAKDKADCQEAILIRDGNVTEGATSNIFIVKGGVIATPKKDNNVLPGITRDLVVELLQGSDMGCEETDITEQELRQADEIWITSSTIGIVPVINLDEVKIADGKPGPVWKRINEVYELFKMNGPHTIQKNSV